MTFQELVTLITTVAAVAGTPAGIYFAAKNERQRQAEAFARERTAAKEDAETAAAREKAAAEVSAGREAIAAAKAIDAGRELLLSQVLALGSKFLRASKDDSASRSWRNWPSLVVVRCCSRTSPCATPSQRSWSDAIASSMRTTRTTRTTRRRNGTRHSSSANSAMTRECYSVSHLIGFA